MFHAVALGLMSGVYPASRAARIDPIQALGSPTKYLRGFAAFV